MTYEKIPTEALKIIKTNIYNLDANDGDSSNIASDIVSLELSICDLKDSLKKLIDRNVYLEEEIEKISTECSKQREVINTLLENQKQYIDILNIVIEKSDFSSCVVDDLSNVITNLDLSASL